MSTSQEKLYGKSSFEKLWNSRRSKDDTRMSCLLSLRILTAVDVENSLDLPERIGSMDLIFKCGTSMDIFTVSTAKSRAGDLLKTVSRITDDIQ